MRTTVLPCLAVALLICAPAAANPISSTLLRLRQVPNTTHVQVNYGAATKNVPHGLVRDGTDLAVTWTELAVFTANSGSGLTSLIAQQFCDCNVTLGSHKYELSATFNGSRMDLDAMIDVVKGHVLPTAKDAGAGEQVNPWSISEPTELQGIDCSAKCVGVNGTPLKPPDSDSGCSLARSPEDANLPPLIAAGLLIAALLTRRRR